MKKIFYLLVILLAFYSCSNESGILSSEINKSQLKGDNNLSMTRVAGDGIHDVLGYGYDITEDFCGENSTRSKVIDINAFMEYNKDRLVPLYQYSKSGNFHYNTATYSKGWGCDGIVCHVFPQWIASKS